MKEPLSYRMRPKTIDEVVGQDGVIGPTTSLYRMIQNGHVPGLLFYGPPGTGKTSLAFAIANTVEREFYSLNAITAGKKDIENVIKEVKEKGIENAIFFIDEIHMLNKLQQDVLLDALEKKVVILIGATTENPYHSVRGAILSRIGQVKQLESLSPSSIFTLLKRALEDKENGLGDMNIHITDELVTMISQTTGDARTSLNLLEDIVYGSEKNKKDEIVVTEETVVECIQNKGFSHDKNGDHHYNTLSAFQKSVRGSDVDAALFYLGRLIEAGDMTSICRRLAVIAFEDIGLANPQTWSATMAAIDCAERVGFPEARIPLASAVSLLCLSPKSNTAYQSLDRALEDVRNGQVGDIPPHLKDSHYKGAKALGHGVEYRYPHNYSVGSFGGWVPQQYLPDAVKDREYYIPKEAGQEKQMAQIHQKFKNAQRKK